MFEFTAGLLTPPPRCERFQVGHSSTPRISQQGEKLFVPVPLPFLIGRFRRRLVLVALRANAGTGGSLPVVGIKALSVQEVCAS